MCSNKLAAAMLAIPGSSQSPGLKAKNEGKRINK
jgi:hypothetical protein